MLELLQSIDDSKSAGSDGLPGCILKNYAKDLTPSVTQLINASLTSSELPTPLKLATVSPIFNISLLPLVSKLLEKVVARQLRSYLEEFSIIPKEQFAYRQHHSTEGRSCLCNQQLSHGQGPRVVHWLSICGHE